MNFYTSVLTLACSYRMLETKTNHHAPFSKPTQRLLLETYKVFPSKMLWALYFVIHQCLYVRDQVCYCNEDPHLPTLWLGFYPRPSTFPGFSPGFIIFLPPQKQLFQGTFQLGSSGGIVTPWICQFYNIYIDNIIAG